MNRLLIIGHRGDRKNFPDNTMEGIASAFEKGADGVEIDVHYRSEVGVYLTHPYIHDTEKIYPLLDNVLQSFSQKGRFLIEIKTPEIEAVEAVVNTIKRYKLKNYELISSVYPLIRYLSEQVSKEHTGLIANSLPQDWWTEEFGNYFLEQYLNLTGASTLYIGGVSGFWNKERVNRFHQKGYRIGAHLFTAEKTEYDQMIDLGVDCCTADDLDVLRWRP